MITTCFHAVLCFRGPSLLWLQALCGNNAFAQSARMPFPQWVAAFRSRARAHGISDATYDRVMGSIKPDTSVYALDKDQPEFREEIWQYLNRRVSDWRITVGKERAKEAMPLLKRVEHSYGVDPYVMLGLWGMETAYGDLITNPKHMRPVTSGACGAGLGRTPAPFLLGAGTAQRDGYRGARMGRSERYDRLLGRGDGPYAVDAGSLAQYGRRFRRRWANLALWEARRRDRRDGAVSRQTRQIPPWRGLGLRGSFAGGHVRRRGNALHRELAFPGVRPANGKPFPRPSELARLWQPVPGGPVFLLTHNFDAVKSYNPANTYALAVCHLGDRIRGEGGFVQEFPGSERPPTLAEVQEIQRRLTALGFNTDGTDGRVGKDTMKAVHDFQIKAGITPADGYAGLKVLARLRATS